MRFRISPEYAARYSFASYDSVLYRCEHGWPGKRWLDGAWGRYEPSEQEFLHMREVGILAPDSVLVAEGTEKDRRVT